MSAMQWGVFNCSDSIHVAPCDSNQEIAKPHTLDFFCYCQPVNERGENGKILVIHNREN